MITSIFNIIVFLALLYGIKKVIFKVKRNSTHIEENNESSNEWDEFFKEL